MYSYLNVCDSFAIYNKHKPIYVRTYLVIIHTRLCYCVAMYVYMYTCIYIMMKDGRKGGAASDVKLEPNMLKFLLIIPSITSNKIYPLFLFYSHIKAYYSLIVLEFFH